MQAVVGHAARNKRDVVVLQPGINDKTVCEIYDAVRAKNDRTIVRAGSDGQGNFYVYMPKRENRIAAATYKAASIRSHRQSLADLLNQSGAALQKQAWLFTSDKVGIMKLTRLSMKDVNREDFNAGELKSHLKPLNDRVRGRDRLMKKNELNQKFSPIPRKASDYYAQFLKKSPADQSILRQALFAKNARLSLAEERAIIKSVDTLLHTYLHQKNNKQTLVSLIRKSPEQDLLLRFAQAWLDHVERPQKIKSANLLLAFSWQKSLTELARTIEKHASPDEHRQPRPLSVSPDRSVARDGMFKRSDAQADIAEAHVFSPFKPRQASDAARVAMDDRLESLPPKFKQTAVPVLIDTSIGSELDVVSLPEEAVVAADDRLESLPPKFKQTAAPVLVDTSVGSELDVVSLPEETVEALHFADEGVLPKVTAGAYTIYAESTRRLTEDASVSQ